jgi:glyoxylase-like metal-dependent hydrolase (beta-lactamase superfamily II)
MRTFTQLHLTTRVASQRGIIAFFICLIGWVGIAKANEDVPMVAEQVTEGAWYVQGVSALGSSQNQNFISNAGFVVTRDGVVVIDALGSPALAQRLIEQIKKVTDKPMTHLIVTHYHADHIYGLQVFKAAGVRVIAHRKALEYLNSETAQLRLQASRVDLAPWVNDQTKLQLADQWIDGPVDLTVGDQLVQLRPVGPSHTPEDLVVYFPMKKLLFAGDLVFRGRIPYVGGADSRQWIAALDALLAMDAKVVVPGHGPKSESAREDMVMTRDYLKYLRASMGEAAKNLDPFDDAYNATDWSQFQHLPLFRVANRMNAYNTYLLMEAQTK